MGTGWTTSVRVLRGWILAWCLAVCLKTSSTRAAGPNAEPDEADIVVVHTMGLANDTVAGTLPPITKDSSCSDMLAWLPPRSSPAVVFQVVSEPYASLEANFISNMELHSTFSRENLYLVCLDEESVAIFDGLGIRCVRYGCLGCPMSRLDVWVLRVEATLCLLNAGQDVLMSDADAIWLRDPTNDFASDLNMDSNVVASRAVMPFPLYHKWGATVCMGFAFFRAGGSAMQAFMTVVGEIVNELGDDQKAVNEALDKLGVVWDPTSDMDFTNSTRPGTGVIENITANGDPLKVTLLPHNKYTRSCRRTPISNDTIVAHCVSSDKGEGMATWMKEAHLWNLPDDNDSGRD
ncbi:unnamed protein product [Ectocarpus sp. CCAP 1310/34]|nr:unnamed protein product [Ectocarpus sp. CCAP 1310/34]